MKDRSHVIGMAPPMEQAHSNEWTRHHPLPGSGVKGGGDGAKEGNPPNLTMGLSHLRPEWREREIGVHKGKLDCKLM